jgi:nucleoside-diphosphate-sugar epimerase
MKTIALTGGTGVLGVRIQEYFKDTDFIIYDGDIRDEKSVKKFCRDSAGCEAFFHLAALVPKQAVDSDFTEAFDINVRGTLNILEGLRQLGGYAPWFFYASTSHVYSSSPSPMKEDGKLEPFTMYGITKLQGEQLCQAYARKFGLKICTGRLFSFSDILQPNLYFIPAMIQKIKNAEKNTIVEIAGINGERDFLTTRQISKTIESLCIKKFEGVVNIGTGTGVNLFKIVKKIAELLGRDDLSIVTKNDSPTFHVADAGILQDLGLQLDNKIDSLLTDMVKNAKN